MAITKPTRNMLSTGVSDSSDSTFLTADSSENATFAGNLVVSGNLTVSGTTTTVSSTVETHADPLIELNTGAGSNSNDLGFVFERGSTGDNAAIIWDESADGFLVGTTTATGTSTGNMSVTAGDFAAGKITVDNILINGTTIGHTGDTDLLTFASGVLTVAGEVSATTLDIGGTNITSTAAEINLLDAITRGSIIVGNSSGASARLAVGSNGQALVSDGTDISWGSAGVSALDGLSDAKTWSASNIIIGHQTTGSLNNANYNTAVGAIALDAITSGDENVALGYGSLSAVNSGSSNIGIGSTAGSTLTTNSNNVFIGADCGKTVTGEGNTFIGKSSGVAATSCDYTVAIGVNAGSGVMTGNNNVLIGSSTGDAITSATEITAVGAGALGSMTTQAGLTAVGFNALNNSSGGNNTAVGHKAGGDAAHTGDANTWIGSNAGGDTTSGHSNAAVGYLAMAANTTGMQNVAVGSSALGANTTSKYITAVGFNALYSHNITNGGGSHNTAVGWKAGQDVTTGSGSTFIGSAAGQNAVTGERNTAVGAAALETLNSSKSDNNAFGYYAFQATTGERNIGMGTSAGAGATTTDDCIFIGHHAGNSTNTQTGNNNIVIGSRSTWGNVNAGGALSSGYSNVLIGEAAGVWSTGITSGFNIVSIGPYTTASAVGGSNQCTFGHNIANQRGNNTVTFGNASSWVGLDYGSTTVYSSSDQRLKDNITTSTAGLSFINDLRPVNFTWKKRKEMPTTFQSYIAEGEEFAEDYYNNKSTTQLGFIAQEVKTVIDNHSELPDGFEMWSVSQQEHGAGEQHVGEGALIPILVKALQELDQKIANKNQEITDLEQRIHDIEQRLI